MTQTDKNLWRRFSEVGVGWGVPTGQIQHILQCKYCRLFHSYLDMSLRWSNALNYPLTLDDPCQCFFPFVWMTEKWLQHQTPWAPWTGGARTHHVWLMFGLPWAPHALSWLLKNLFPSTVISVWHCSHTQLALSLQLSFSPSFPDALSLRVCLTFSLWTKRMLFLDLLGF